MTEAKLAPNLPGWMAEHANSYLSSGGTDGHMYNITRPGVPEMTVPSLLLTTTGRKSGERFIFPLFYGKDGDSYLVIASKGGAPQHPGWYRNILADPDVEVQVGTAKLKARARIATGEERARLWEKALEFWPPYADYQRKTERQIPVVVLDPVRYHQRHCSSSVATLSAVCIATRASMPLRRRRESPSTKTTAGTSCAPCGRSRGQRPRG